MSGEGGPNAESPAGFKSGFVAVIGAPNVGKSTLVNRLAGKKVAGVSERPQTTRRRILGVRNGPGYQMIFVDTPGLAPTPNKLGDVMMKSARAAAREADLILLVVDSTRPREVPELDKTLGGGKAPVMLVLSKADLVPKPSLLPMIASFNSSGGFEEIVPVSALEEDGTSLLLDLILKRLPAGPAWYGGGGGEDAAYTGSLVQEVVQEKVFARMRQEVPYGCAVLVEDIERKGGLLRVAAQIIVEREGHKGMIIGKGGAGLKAIGTAAREELERLLNCRMFLGLHVRVEKGWRDRDAMLGDLGYLPREREEEG